MPYPIPSEDTPARQAYDLLGTADRQHCHSWWETGQLAEGFEDLPKKRQMRIFAALSNMKPRSRRDKNASMQVTDDEMAMIDLAALAKGQSRSQFMRDLVLVEAAAIADAINDEDILDVPVVPDAEEDLVDDADGEEILVEDPEALANPEAADHVSDGDRQLAALLSDALAADADAPHATEPLEH